MSDSKNQTPREPDRFDAQADEIIANLRCRSISMGPRARPQSTALLTKDRDDIATALRAEHASALERAAQVVDLCCNRCGERIRALVPSAAAPAAETGKEISDILGRGHIENPCEGEPGDAETYAAETGKAQGAEALEPWDLLAQARDWLDFMVKHPGDGVPLNLIARIDAKLAARAAPPKEPPAP